MFFVCVPGRVPQGFVENCEDLQLEATVISFGAALSAAEKARQKVTLW